MIKKIILFSILIVMSLQFRNATGGYMPQREIEYFEEIVRQASLYFVSDVNDHIRYIQQKMDYLFGSKMYTYYVGVQTTDWSATSHYLGNWVYSQSVSRNNINKINKSWSYLLVKVWKNTYDLKHITGIGRGKGFTDYDV